MIIKKRVLEIQFPCWPVIKVNQSDNNQLKNIQQNRVKKCSQICNSQLLKSLYVIRKEILKCKTEKDVINRFEKQTANHISQQQGKIFLYLLEEKENLIVVNEKQTRKGFIEEVDKATVDKYLSILVEGLQKFYYNLYIIYKNYYLLHYFENTIQYYIEEKNLCINLTIISR